MRSMTKEITIIEVDREMTRKNIKISYMIIWQIILGRGKGDRESVEKKTSESERKHNGWRRKRNRSYRMGNTRKNKATEKGRRDAE